MVGVYSISFFFFFVIEGVAGAAGFFIFRARVGVLGVGVGVGVVATVEGADERTSRGTCAGAGVGGGGISPRSQLDYLDRQTSSFSSAAEDPPRSPRGQKSAFSDLSYHLPERFLDKNDLEQSSAFGYR